MAGAIVLVVLMVLAAPPVLMLAGAAWSALFGVLSADVAGAAPEPGGPVGGSGAAASSSRH